MLCCQNQLVQILQSSSCSNSKKQRKKEACTISVINPISPYASCISTEMSYNKLNMTTFNGVRPLFPLSLPKIMSACAPASLLEALPDNASGVIGLGRSGMALPAQLAARVGFSNKFAFCPSAYSLPGVAFFGEGPYDFPGAYLNGQSILEYAPLKTNPSHQQDYYVPVKEISVLGTKVAVNGWTKLNPSTTPYTTMATPLYKVIAAAFLRSVTQVPPPVKPFELCGLMWEYSIEMYPFLPIDLVMENGTVWTMTPASAMKQPTEKLVCLAIFDGGNNGENAIVIGSYQMQRVFSLFDLNRSSVAISQHLTYSGWACENFYGM